MTQSRLETFKRYVEKDPRNSFARYSLAMEYRTANQLEAALTTFEELIAQDPAYVPAYLMAAEAAVDLGAREKAGAILRKGIAAAQAAGNSHAVSKMTDLLDSLA